VVAGPLYIVVRRGDTVVLEAKRPLLLPPANDVAALVEQGEDAEALGTMDEAGRLWIPLQFGGFGAGKPMPSCPADMAPLVAFAVGLGVTRRDAEGEELPHTELSDLKKSRFFLGDFVLHGVNVYGEKLPTKLNVRNLKGRGIAICALNDSLDLVLMIPLRQGATGPFSEILPLVRDGAPFAVKLRDISAEPPVAPLLGRVKKDSFGNACFATP
jgi:hypothetical protein